MSGRVMAKGFIGFVFCVSVLLSAEEGVHCEGGVCRLVDHTEEIAAAGTAEIQKAPENIKEEAKMDFWSCISEGNTKEAMNCLSKTLPDGFNTARAKEAVEKNYPVVRLETDKGDIYLSLYEDAAPNTVASFMYLITNKYYDGLTFHRVVPDFVIQGGDPSGTGSGGPGYHFGLEISDYIHEQGVLSMARTSDPNSNGSQFFITHTKTPHLDKNYTVFGSVILGQKVVNSIAVGDKMKKLTILHKRDHDYIPKPYSGKLPY